MPRTSDDVGSTSSEWDCLAQALIERPAAIPEAILVAQRTSEDESKDMMGPERPQMAAPTDPLLLCMWDVLTAPLLSGVPGALPGPPQEQSRGHAPTPLAPSPPTQSAAERAHAAAASALRHMAPPNSDAPETLRSPGSRSMRKRPSAQSQADRPNTTPFWARENQTGWVWSSLTEAEHTILSGAPGARPASPDTARRLADGLQCEQRRYKAKSRAWALSVHGARYSMKLSPAVAADAARGARHVVGVARALPRFFTAAGRVAPYVGPVHIRRDPKAVFEVGTPVLLPSPAEWPQRLAQSLLRAGRVDALLARWAGSAERARAIRSVRHRQHQALQRQAQTAARACGVNICAALSALETIARVALARAEGRRSLDVQIPVSVEGRGDGCIASLGPPLRRKTTNKRRKLEMFYEHVAEAALLASSADTRRASVSAWDYAAGAETQVQVAAPRGRSTPRWKSAAHAPPAADIYGGVCDMYSVGPTRGAAAQATDAKASASSNPEEDIRVAVWHRVGFVARSHESGRMTRVAPKVHMDFLPKVRDGVEEDAEAHIAGELALRCALSGPTTLLSRVDPVSGKFVGCQAVTGDGNGMEMKGRQVCDAEANSASLAAVYAVLRAVTSLEKGNYLLHASPQDGLMFYRQADPTQFVRGRAYPLGQRMPVPARLVAERDMLRVRLWLRSAFSCVHVTEMPRGKGGSRRVLCVRNFNPGISAGQSGSAPRDKGAEFALIRESGSGGRAPRFRVCFLGTNGFLVDRQGLVEVGREGEDRGAAWEISQAPGGGLQITLDGTTRCWGVRPSDGVICTTGRENKEPEPAVFTLDPDSPDPFERAGLRISSDFRRETAANAQIAHSLHAWVAGANSHAAADVYVPYAWVPTFDGQQRHTFRPRPPGYELPPPYQVPNGPFVRGKDCDHAFVAKRCALNGCVLGHSRRRDAGARGKRKRARK